MNVLATHSAATRGPLRSGKMWNNSTPQHARPARGADEGVRPYTS